MSESAMNLPAVVAPGDLRQVSLQDKYRVCGESVFMNGTQALVRLLMLQKARDRAAGLNTGGFVSGYRGSPLGGVDQTLWKARQQLEQDNIRFNPGVNEELAATSVWGTQQVGMKPGATVDGVFSMWYGKGPGVDRSLDVLKHANAAGTSKHGGVIALAGDDHAAKSSSLPHQSDHVFAAAGIPVFFPASVQEILDLGIHAWAMSRYAGVWVAMKCISDVVESTATVIADPHRVQVKLPEDFSLPDGGVSIRWPDAPLQQEARLLDHKLYAALAYIRANRLNHDVTHPKHPRFGIIASGKAYLDTLQALSDLGLSLADCEDIGIRLHKVSVIWPLDAVSSRDFATGLQEILVVEEKRQLIEYALKEELYGWRDDVRPRVIGKFDSQDGGEYAVPRGEWNLPIRSELSPPQIANAIAARVLKLDMPEALRTRIAERLARINSLCTRTHGDPLEARLAYYCSGCPHNTSTHVPEGSRVLAGIGCHYMAMWMPERRTETFTQMGGEGVPWIGQSPFTEEKHVFANLGDGTYFHSGILAIRAAVAAGVNITYKILYNDAVAMTGGQPIDGTLTVPQIVRQMQAERVKRIVVVSDDIEKYDDPAQQEKIPDGIEIRHRDRLDELQRELREQAGCSVIVYDQTCAAEKRRRRKVVVDGKPLMDDPPKRLLINDAVCEGCGDCSVQSSCLSIEPLETELGRKRQINQSTCNKDYSCVKGFCPSFVTVKGGKLRKTSGSAELQPPSLPEPTLPQVSDSFNVLVTGVGGSGVVTVGQLLGMAAHLERRPVTTLDMTGISQKGGAVLSHIRIGGPGASMTAARVAAGSADAIIGCDLVVTAGEEALSKMSVERTRVAVNASVAPTASFLRQRDWAYPVNTAEAKLQAAAGAERCSFVDAGKLATRLIGDSIAVNPFMLGFAWQKGMLPLSREALRKAIEINGVAVAQNQKAFEWGRAAAHDPEGLKRLLAPAQVVTFPAPRISLKQVIEQRVALLTDYMSAAYAGRYRRFVERAAQVEAGVSAQTGLTEAIARNYAKLLAYKDEYEVGRLYSAPAFREKLAATFDGDYRIEYNLAPPLFAKRNARGELIKRPFGAWMGVAFRMLAALRFLRGTPLDLFGYTRERRDERALIERYEQLIDEVLCNLDADRLALAIEIAEVPDQIRGFGHVKEASMKSGLATWERLIAKWRTSSATRSAAA
jgi:indolepyruvate ferredoxin oxidoreductase